MFMLQVIKEQKLKQMERVHGNKDLADVGNEPPLNT